MTLKGNLKGKSKRQTSSANERKFRIFSEAVWAVADSSELLRGREPRGSGGCRTPALRDPHLPDARLRAELPGSETSQCLGSPTPGFTKPCRHGGFAQISEQILRSREQGRSLGQQSSRPPPCARSLHVRISTVRGEGRVPPHVSSLRNPRVSVVPSQKPGLNRRDNDSFHSHWPPAF